MTQYKGTTSAIRRRNKFLAKKREKWGTPATVVRSSSGRRVTETGDICLLLSEPLSFRPDSPQDFCFSFPPTHYRRNVNPDPDHETITQEFPDP